MAGVSLQCGDCGALLRSVEEAQEHAELTSTPTSPNRLKLFSTLFAPLVASHADPKPRVICIQKELGIANLLIRHLRQRNQ
ncbi:hypothetical protein K1719_014138 [Acacia pycnantha]|nr:hypothetical protein K1719_014138 [Acacia pycnantha]